MLQHVGDLLQVKSQCAFPLRNGYSVNLGVAISLVGFEDSKGLVSIIR